MDAGIILGICLLIAAVAGGIPVLATRSASRKIRDHLNKNSNTVDSPKLPHVTVILPCRGNNPELESNLNAVLNQDYPSFDILMVTTTDDESLPLLKKLEDSNPDKVRTVHAPQSATGAQKLTNQLAALENIKDEANIISFMDTDGHPRPNYLKSMVGMLLESDDTGLVSGWWWYSPRKNTYWGHARCCWSAGAIPFLFDNKWNIASGGSMVIRRETFERTGVAAQWRNAVSDGLSLAAAVKKLGLQLRFNPTAMMTSNVPSDFKTSLEWTNRQATISWVYQPKFVLATGIAYATQAATLATAVAGSYWAMGPLGAGLVFSFFTLLQLLNASLLLNASYDLLPEQTRQSVFSRRWWYMISAPAAAWMYGVNLLRTAFSKRISWAGISYHMISPNKTIVRHPKSIVRTTSERFTFPKTNPASR